MSRATIYRWYDAFEKGRESARLKGGPGAPSWAVTAVTINMCGSLLADDPTTNVRELARILQISQGLVHNIVHKHLQMSRVCAKWVPKLLTAEQKQARVDICQMWEGYGREWFANVVTTDESWAYLYDPKTKQQSSQWVQKGGAPPLKQKSQRSATKVMVVTFFDAQGMIYVHAIPPGQTVNQTTYLAILRQLIRKHMSTKRPQYKGGNWKLHLDNAPCHTANSVRQFLASKGIKIVPHPPYSPDLAPSDFFLYPQMKKVTRGVKYESREEVLLAVQGSLQQLLANGFQHVFDMWQHRWNKCIRLQGEYIERTRVADCSP